MYIITEDKLKNYLEIKNIPEGIYAEISLNDGGSLQALTLNNVPLIVDLSPLTYSTTYASALLFPFANRIKDGQYGFKNKNYQLLPNNKEENNALHGLVYNKPFVVTHQSAQKDEAEIIMSYAYEETEKGFPFPFTIQLTYTFTKNSLELNVSVVNTSETTFPFTIGWHPYFLSADLDRSVLKFKSERKLHIGDRNIGQDLMPISPIDSVALDNKTLDDCWQLKGNEVVFDTPKYQLYLSSSEADSFLQAYTPPKKNIIAIEPTTGVSDSFNNKIGLRFLGSKDLFDITWRLKIHTN